MATPPKTLNWNNKEIRDANQTIRAINHKLRMRLMDIVHDAGSITVTELYVRLRIEQSVCSQHIGVLRKQGLLIADRDGKFMRYAINYDRFDQVMEDIAKING